MSPNVLSVYILYDILLGIAVPQIAYIAFTIYFLHYIYQSKRTIHPSHNNNGSLNKDPLPGSSNEMQYKTPVINDDSTDLAVDSISVEKQELDASVRVQNKMKSSSKLFMDATNKHIINTAMAKETSISTKRKRLVKMYPYPGPSTSKTAFTEKQVKPRSILKSTDGPQRSVDLDSDSKRKSHNRTEYMQEISDAVHKRNITQEKGEYNEGILHVEGEHKGNTDPKSQPVYVQKPSAPRQNVVSQMRVQRAVTVLAFTLLFITTQLPIIIYTLSKRDENLSSAQVRVEWAILRNLMFMNYAANIVVLYSTNKRFQDRFKRLIRCSL